MVRLPLAWFDATHRAELTAAAGGSVLASMGVPAYLLRPLITATVVPAVIAASLLVLDPPLGVALLVLAPVLVLALRVGGRIAARADAERADADTGIGERVVEFAQAQHVLRAHGRTGRDAGLVDAILVRHRAASRALIGRTVAGLVAFGAVMRVVLVAALAIAVTRVLGGPSTRGARSRRSCSSSTPPTSWARRRSWGSACAPRGATSGPSPGSSTPPPSPSRSPARRACPTAPTWSSTACPSPTRDPRPRPSRASTPRCPSAA
ncbi:Iron import ATP-binding/permease protein IrtB [Clavibacter michiganensis subsp. michiganensis]|uniref:Iron import ATP-binding/permease protein IrtB n=1 Tax=Clavibacter michiganensis subsp. michiganensis TaxID=33013 RepID=A0A251XN68_CLAMM|nr:Iron import ATP-binding/permease protein IrtB [Clavibacter michiganensis subsp. michiganensis]OUE04876.1 Iron import ATP-binding/permease protein IrtB [Clavibacter michiganensis subsp. michiganensis]